LHTQLLFISAFALNLVYDATATKLEHAENLQRLADCECNRLAEEVEKYQILQRVRCY
jgi:hypothetical protein